MFRRILSAVGVGSNKLHDQLSRANSYSLTTGKEELKITPENAAEIGLWLLINSDRLPNKERIKRD